MRAPSARRLASAAISATLLIGIAAPAAVAVDHEPQHERAMTGAKDPVQGAEALLGQVKTLGDLVAVLKPVTEVLDTVLNAKDGISPAQATQLLKTVQNAIAAATAQAPAPVPQAPLTPADPGSTPATNVPTLPSTTLPAPATLPALPLSADSDAKAPSADAGGDALAALQTAVGDLLAAASATPPDASKVLAAATAVVGKLVNATVALLLGGGLPLPLPPGGLPTDAAPGAVGGLPAGGLPPTS
ncbi:MULTISPECIES: hypothetical protein [unclassified Streptomyces]|uniref:hypothetical protein n=1 Tax=unclassified Streptomyces TaxID=2593676 RepID=UPI0036E2AF90